jgi:hypothetical protein
MKLLAILMGKLVLTEFVDVESHKHAKVDQLDTTVTLQIVCVNAPTLWMLVVLKKHAMEAYASVDPVNHVMAKEREVIVMLITVSANVLQM